MIIVLRMILCKRCLWLENSDINRIRGVSKDMEN